MFFAKINNVNLKKVLWSYFISSIGNFSARVTLAIIVYELTGSKTTLAASFIVTKLPIVLFGNSFGRLSDQYNPKKLMVWSDLVGVLLFVVLAFFYKELGVVLSCLIFFLSYALSSLFNSAKTRIVAKLCPEKKDLNYAVATLSELVYLAIALGPFLAGYMIEFINIKFVLIFNSLTFVVSAMLLNGVKIAGLKETLFPAAMKTSFSLKTAFGFIENFKKVRLNPTLTQTSVFYGTRCLAYGFFNAMIPVFALMHLNVGSSGLGLYFFFSCLGGVLGATIYKKYVGLKASQHKSMQYYYFLLLSISEAILISLCLSATSQTQFLIFGFLFGIPMLLVESRIDFIYIHEAGESDKASVRGFQFFLKSLCFTIGIALAVPFTLFVSNKMISIIMFLGLIIAALTLLLFRKDKQYAGF